MSSGGFQTQIGVQPAPAVEGDFASTNPRHSVLAGPGGLVAGAGGIRIGYFAWINDATVDSNQAPATVTQFGGGPVAGFVHREQQGLITTYLAGSGFNIPAGFPMTLESGGDFWVKNNGTTAAAPLMKAYAAYGTGAVSFAATASAPTSTATGFTLSAQTNSSAASTITGNVLTTGPAVTGSLYNGTVLSGTGVATGTTIVSQLSGTALGVGTYAVSISEQSVASTTISGTYGLLTLSGTITGTFALGQSISGTSVAAGSTITALGTGVGGAGTYITLTATASSGTLTAASSVETKWIAMSTGAVGELVKISEKPLG